MAGATPILLAWTGTMGLGLLMIGFWKAGNAQTRVTVSALAFIFWVAFTFGSYGVFIGDTASTRERMTMFAFLGLMMALISFVVLVYNALQVLGVSMPQKGRARA